MNKRPTFLAQLLFLLLLFTSFTLLLLHLISNPNPNLKPYPPVTLTHLPLKVYVAKLPCSYNYGLISEFYSLEGPDRRLGANPDADRFSPFFSFLYKTFLLAPPYPENPLIKPHAAEYWLLRDLEMSRNQRGGKAVVRVRSLEEADVVFVPFFASLSAEMELGWGQKGKFKKKDSEKNGDYRRQREVVDMIKNSVAWRRSGGRDHVFVMSVHNVSRWIILRSTLHESPNNHEMIHGLTSRTAQCSTSGDKNSFLDIRSWTCAHDPVAMWHVRSEITPAILLVEDFGGWYKTDMIMRRSSSSSSPAATTCTTASRDVHAICSNNSSTYNNVMILHTEASLLKDVIVPYNHLLPRLHLSDKNQPRHTLLYFKGTKHRHRGGSIREKLSKLLENELGVKMEEGSLNNATGLEDAEQGMRGSEFCLHPAGDTPTSCRLFDAIASLCIPVIVSDEVELPFEGILDYTEFAVFVSVKNALTPNWLVNHLRGFSEEQKERFRANLAGVQSYFEFDNPGVASLIWEMIYQKLPVIRQALVAERRKLDGIEHRRPVTCLCT